MSGFTPLYNVLDLGKPYSKYTNQDLKSVLWLKSYFNIILVFWTCVSLLGLPKGRVSQKSKQTKYHKNHDILSKLKKVLELGS